MDLSVKWSPEATEDLESIAEYIARDSEFYARSVVSKILATSRSIPEQLYIGRVVPEIGNDKIRERFVYKEAMNKIRNLVDVFFNRNAIIVNAKYEQLFIYCQFGGGRTMNIHKRYLQ